MLPDQNNFSFCLHIFCFISFHNCRGECCRLALVATSYKMQHPKGKKKKSILFLLKNWSQIFRGREINQVCQALNPCRHMQPQPHSAYMGNPAKAGMRNCLAPLYLSLYSSSLLFLFIPPLYSSLQSWSVALRPYSYPVTSCDRSVHSEGSQKGDGHQLLLLMTMLYRSWAEKASQRKSPSLNQPLQKGHPPTHHDIHSSVTWLKWSSLHELHERKVTSFGTSASMLVLVLPQITFGLKPSVMKGKKCLLLIEMKRSKWKQ